MQSAGSDKNAGTRIGIITNPKHAHGRNIIRGAISYLREFGDSVDAHILDTDRHNPLSQFEEFDGFLEATPEPRLSQLENSKPIVTIDSPMVDYGMLSVPMDNYGIGKAAAEALHARGLVSYGYYDGTHGDDPRVERRSKERLDGFRDGLRELGVSDVDAHLHIHQPSTSEACRLWLSGLAKPAGVFGFNDLGCVDVSEGCRLLNLTVPQEVAVVGVDDDKLLCSLSQPPLSSIDSGAQQIAYNAMKALVEIIEEGGRGGEVPEAPTPYLVARESTGASSVQNETVQKALQVISASVFGGRLSVEEVARRSGVSLSVLEELFKEHLGRTIRAEILQKQLEQFKFLLRTSDLTVESISEKMGVESTSLRRSFIRVEGILPGAYRGTYRRSGKSRPGPVVRVRPSLIDICFLNGFQGQSAFDYLRGAQDYARQFFDVHLSIRTVGFDETEGDLLPSSDEQFHYYDAFIAPPPMALPPEAIGKRPIVYLDHQRLHDLSWSVSIDNHELGALAARHFLAKGFEHFVYCDHPGREDKNDGVMKDQRTSERYRGFRETIAEAGVTNEVLGLDVMHGDFNPPDWLTTLPKRTAVYCFNDTIALILLDHCRELGIRVPEDVALLGTDNDELLCKLSHPALSSIEVGFRRAGFVAMKTVVEAARGEASGADEPISILPRYVVERGSTLGPACDDEVLVTAIRYMRESYREALRVGGIAKVCGVSRRTLESRFQQHLQTTVASHLQGIRIDAAKTLLAGTKQPIAEVAEETGFQHARHFSQVFRGQTGITPRAFRLARGLVW